MADRRTDDSPLAPRRSLSAPAQPAQQGEAPKRPLTERVTAAIASAGSAVQSAAKPTPAAGGDRTGTTGREPDPRRPGVASTRPRGSRRARLRLVHVDPWSVMKTAFLLSIAIGIVTVVAVAVVWSVLGAAGVWESINKTVSDVIGGDSGSTFDVQNYVGTNRVMGFTMIVAVVDVILITAIATLGAFIYNLAAALLGGIEVTLAEDDR